MLNERRYERETNCSGMLRTSSRLLRAQRVLRACRICHHAHELAAAWPDLPTLMLPLLSVRVINNNEKTFSMFSRDPSRSLTLSQHFTRHAQWATNMSMWACFPSPSSIHWYTAFSAMGKLAWAFVSNGRAISSISTKQAFYSLKPPGKSYVPQVCVRLVRMAYFRFYNFPIIVFV